MVRWLFTFLLPFALASTALAERKSETGKPFGCNNGYKLFDAGISRELQIGDAEQRELLIMQALGPEKLAIIEKAIGAPPFAQVETEANAMAIVERMKNDPTAYGPVLKILDSLPPDKQWAVYLASGFDEYATESDGHRDAVMATLGDFVRVAPSGQPMRNMDIGLGTSKTLMGAMIEYPDAINAGLDITNSGNTLGASRINRITDLTLAKHNDPFMTQYGRTVLIRGSGTDKEILGAQQYDNISLMLTLFALGKGQQAAAQNIAEHLHPGGHAIVIDPTDKASVNKDGYGFLRTVVKSGLKNNPGATNLGVTIVAAQNLHRLLKTPFLTGEQQVELFESTGQLRQVGQTEDVYYGIATKNVFEKIE